MKFIVEVELEEDKYRKFKEVIKKGEKTVNQVMQMFIDKTVDEKSIDWLYTSINGEVRTKNIKTKTAIQLFSNKGYNLNNYNTSFASKNADHDVYWINPDKRHLSEEWFMILNDYINKRLYLLHIPKNSISELKMRNDKICNVSITYNDINFVDIHSGIYFKNYLVDMLEYESLLS